MSSNNYTFFYLEGNAPDVSGSEAVELSGRDSAGATLLPELIEHSIE